MGSYRRNLHLHLSKKGLVPDLTRSTNYVVGVDALHTDWKTGTHEREVEKTCWENREGSVGKKKNIKIVHQ